MSGLTYAKAGVTPFNWWDILVIDLDTGQELHDVLEVDTAAGWAERYKKDEKGRLRHHNGVAETERVEGRYELREKPRDA